MELVRPALEHLESYRGALIRALELDPHDDSLEVTDELKAIEENPARFLDLKDDRQAVGGDVRLPDGSKQSRLPGITRWMWDGQYCGSINLRWQSGKNDLPATVLGHIGYDVVPWKQNLGYASQALKAILPEAQLVGLTYVEITTGKDNIFSQKVIVKNGGILIEEFTKPIQYGLGPAIRYRIYF